MGLAQRVMEWPWAVRRYDTLVRPGLTWIGSGCRPADERRWLERHFRPLDDGPVLDIACGTGTTTRWLADRVGADRVVGLDISPPMLAAARRAAPDIRFVEGSAQELPFKDNRLAAIHCFGALHLFPDPVGALREMGRCLAPGGRATLMAVTGGPVSPLGIRPFSLADCPVPVVHADVHRWMTWWVIQVPDSDSDNFFRKRCLSLAPAPTRWGERSAAIINV